MDSIWTGTNWGLIISLVVGSAVLAFLGDVLGFKYGKQRISLFGMRPRYTSHLITAFTGIFISLVILAVLSVFSESVRTALFSMKHIQQQLLNLQMELHKNKADAEVAISELISSKKILLEQQELLQVSLDMSRFELDSLRNDRVLLENEKNNLEISVKTLRDESEELKRALSTMRLESIAFHANLLLGQQSIPAETSSEKLKEYLETLKKTVRENILSSVFEKSLNYSYHDMPIDFDIQQEDNILAEIAMSPYNFYIRALCSENVAFGDRIKISLEYGRSLLIYNKGEPVYRKLVSPQNADFDAERALHMFLRELKLKAIRDGVLPDPSTNSVGTLEGEEFFDAVENLKKISNPVIINAIALKGIYTEGPVKIKIEFQE